MTDEILYKYISHQATSEESEQVLEWADESDDRKKELARLRNVWIMAGLENEIDPVLKEREINRIWKVIRELNLLEKKKVFRMKFLRYAAAVLVLVGTSGTIGYLISNFGSKTSSGYTEIIVPRGERSSVVLPDGSTVQLNSDSKLRFVPEFGSGKRRVILEGEGFFQVTHNSSHPFVVETANLQVEVLGTSFDVCSYPDDSLTTTYLETGKVKISNKQLGEVFLSPNEALSYNKSTNQSTKFKLDDRRLSDWTKGILAIDGETIGEFAKKLERRFNIRITFGDQEVKNHIYSGSIKDEDLNTVLEALRFASSINYERNGDTINLYSQH